MGESIPVPLWPPWSCCTESLLTTEGTVYLAAIINIMALDLVEIGVNLPLPEYRGDEFLS